MILGIDTGEFREYNYLMTPTYEKLTAATIALASREDANDDGTPLVDSDGVITTRTAARQACADAINNARAMED